MIGNPKYLNTREDYLYVKDNLPENVWRPAFEALLQNRQQWFNTGALAVGASGIEDDTHKVVEDEKNKYQFELREDPNCLLNRMGFSVGEVSLIMTEGE